MLFLVKRGKEQVAEVHIRLSFEFASSIHKPVLPLHLNKCLQGWNVSSEKDDMDYKSQT